LVGKETSLDALKKQFANLSNYADTSNQIIENVKVVLEAHRHRVINKENAEAQRNRLYYDVASAVGELHK